MEKKDLRTFLGPYRKWLIYAAITLPAGVWVYLNFVLTLVLGHPTRETREVPYAELLAQSLLAILVFMTDSRRQRLLWLAILLPVPLWSLVRAISTDTSPAWSLALSAILLSPYIALLLSCQVSPAIRRALSVTFVVIVLSQFVVFPLNFLGLLADDTAAPYDRFSGTILGRGGYFSSYVVLAGAFYFGITKARVWQKFLVFIVAFSYAWFAEVKLIFFVAGVVTASVLLFASSAKRLFMTIPLALLAVLAGAWMSISLPSSYGLLVPQYNFSIVAPQESLDRFGSLSSVHGSKIRATISLLNPSSALWSENGESVLVGVGPVGGLSNLSRTLDANTILATLSRPDREFRDEARLLAGPMQRDQSLATQPESTVNGIVSELGYVGLFLFLGTGAAVTFLSLRRFDRAAVGVFAGFGFAFVPLFSLWEIPGFWMVLALGLASTQQKSRVEGVPTEFKVDLSTTWKANLRLR